MSFIMFGWVVLLLMAFAVVAGLVAAKKIQPVWLLVAFVAILVLACAASWPGFWMMGFWPWHMPMWHMRPYWP